MLSKVCLNLQEDYVYKIGIDVGGTNTDAVVLTANNQLLAAVKRPTTADVEEGIFTALDEVIAQAEVDAEDVAHVMLGTTHAANAIIERKELAKIGVIRVALPAGEAVDPLFGWPDDLRASIGADVAVVKGGFEFDGRPLNPDGLDESECRAVLRKMRDNGCEAITVCGIYSLVRDDQERQVAAWAAEEVGSDVPVTLSSEIASLGLLERENAACLNAALVRVAHKAVRGLSGALERRGIDAHVYFAQNDGTLMSLKYVQRYPIFTISSGPTNSIRGAAYLSGLSECIVVDVGGTSTDVGALVRGFPRESSLAVTIGGVSTNFRMPDIYSIGLGGGSLVRSRDGQSPGMSEAVNGEAVTVGPDSVGYRLTDEARSWGGDVLTATDVAIAAGRAEIDAPGCDPKAVEDLPEPLVTAALQRIDEMVADAVDRILTSNDPPPVVLVGGGGVIVGEPKIPGVSEIVRPEHYSCANAIGAAIAQVSGEIDRMWDLEQLTRDEALAEAKSIAADMAVEAGAQRETVDIVDVEEVPLAYLPSNALRIRVKAAGDLEHLT